MSARFAAEGACREGLTGCRRQNDETSPVVLDELAHCDMPSVSNTF